MGRSWNTIATTGSTWGVDVAKDDPNVVMYGVYGGGTSYISSNAGSSFVSSPLTGSNSAVLAYDRATYLVHQAGNGIWKYNITYTVPTSNAAALAVTAPNGGENWSFGTQRNITWTSTNVSTVKIEYKTSTTGAWQTIAASAQSTGTYAWTIPNTPTTQGRGRCARFERRELFYHGCRDCRESHINQFWNCSGWFESRRSVDANE
jgi:hypothetical protein